MKCSRMFRFTKATSIAITICGFVSLQGLPVFAADGVSGASAPAKSSESISFNVKDADVTDLISAYAKASGQTFVVNPGVKGKITIAAEGPVSLDEAYALLSIALAENGYAISNRGHARVVMNARDIQRSMLETVTELPSPRPERMVTWVIKVKGIPAAELFKELLRVLPSKHGEMSIVASTNQLVTTDYISNLYRVKAVIDEVEKVAMSEAASKPKKKK